MNKDINDKPIFNGCIIDIHQTVNGQNLFAIVDVATLDIRYCHDLTRKYEYDTKDLLAPDKHTGESDFEIVGRMTEADIIIATITA
jgi:hypothetical protein